MRRNTVTITPPVVAYSRSASRVSGALFELPRGGL